MTQPRALTNEHDNAHDLTPAAADDTELSEESRSDDSEQRLLEAAKTATFRHPTGVQTWCEANSTVFMTLLATPPRETDSAQRHRDYADFSEAARDWCVNRCDRFAECLRGALDSPNLEGFVAGTSEIERERLRETMGVTPAEAPNLDSWAGVAPTPTGVAYDINATADAIAATPDATNAQIAARLGIATVTVKRHRRKLRELPPPTDEGASSDECLKAFREEIHPDLPAIAESSSSRHQYREAHISRLLDEVLWWVAEHRSAAIPQHAVGRPEPDGRPYRLGARVKAVRAAYKSGRLSPDEIAQFEALPDWRWNHWEAIWRSRFVDTAERFINGELDARDRRWLAQQRQRWAAEVTEQPSLATAEPGTERRYARLLDEARCWVWERGSAAIPQHALGRADTDGRRYRLGERVAALRVAYRQGQLTADEVAVFEALPGWRWSHWDHEWRTRFADVAQRYAEDGLTSEDRGWLSVQRQRWSKLDPAWRALFDAHPGLIDASPCSRVEEFTAACAQWLSDNDQDSIATMPYAATVMVDGEEVAVGRRATYYRRRYRGMEGARRLPAADAAMIERLPGWTWEMSQKHVRAQQRRRVPA